MWAEKEKRSDIPPVEESGHAVPKAEKEKALWSLGFVHTSMYTAIHAQCRPFFREGGMSQRGSSERAEGPGLHGYNKVTVKAFIRLYPSTFNPAVVKSYNTLSTSPKINTIIWFSAFTAAEEFASWNVLQSATGCCFTPGSEALEFVSWKNILVCNPSKNMIWSHTAHQTLPALCRYSGFKKMGVPSSCRSAHHQFQFTSKIKASLGCLKTRGTGSCFGRWNGIICIIFDRWSFIKNLNNKNDKCITYSLAAWQSLVCWLSVFL